MVDGENPAAAAVSGRVDAMSGWWAVIRCDGCAVQTLTETIPQNLFAFSIIPYSGFLYHLTKSKKAPPLVLFGFYFLLVFVFATIPAGIYGAWVDGGLMVVLLLAPCDGDCGTCMS